MAAPEPVAPPVVTVGALVLDAAGRGLLVRTHKWHGRWGVPGGKIARGETAEAALKRELREETGLDVDEVRFVAVYEAIDSPEFFKPAHMILLNYTARTAGEAPAVALCDEAQEYRWASREEALALPLNSFTRALVEAAHAQGAFA